jgi:hypothetical protein
MPDETTTISMESKAGPEPLKKCVSTKLIQGLRLRDRSFDWPTPPIVCVGQNKAPGARKPSLGARKETTRGRSNLILAPCAIRRQMMTEAYDGDGLWDELPGRLLHETQIHLIEAMRWIDRPLSPTDLTQVLSEQPNLTAVSYHVRRLRQLQIVKPVGEYRRRGALGTFYSLNRDPK